MAKTYIVSGHLGGMYLSCDDPDLITEPCGSCGDSDWICGEFDDGDPREAAEELWRAYLGDYRFWTPSVGEDYGEEDVGEELLDLTEAMSDKAVTSFTEMLGIGGTETEERMLAEREPRLGQLASEVEARWAEVRARREEEEA